MRAALCLALHGPKKKSRINKKEVRSEVMTGTYGFKMVMVGNKTVMKDDSPNAFCVRPGE